MSEFSYPSIAEQLMADFRREHQLVNRIIWGCIEYRWALGDEERAMAEAMIYNAFETYVVDRGMPLPQAEVFCEQNLEPLMRLVDEIL